MPLMNLVLGCLYDLWHHLKAAFIWYMQVFQSVSFYTKKLVQIYFFSHLVDTGALLLVNTFKVQYFPKIK